MKKKTRPYAVCPSCKLPKDRQEIELVLKNMARMIGGGQEVDYKKLDFDIYTHFHQAFFDWACDDCLSSKKAIMAKPELQNGCWKPQMAYTDTSYTCDSCQKEFLFKKEEKKYWYEELKFWNESIPNQCLECRKEIRKLKAENDLLSTLLRKEEKDLEVTEIEQIIEVYDLWGKEQRKKYFQALLKKKLYL